MQTNSWRAAAARLFNSMNPAQCQAGLMTPDVLNSPHGLVGLPSRNLRVGESA
jgi:hypothetical protein